MLEILRYRIKVSASEYAKYYFHLRSMMTRLGIIRGDASTKPLDLIGARRLQLATETLESTSIASKEGSGVETRPRSSTNARAVAPPSISRTVSTDASGRGDGAGVGHIFNKVGLDEIIHSTHTDADGVDRTAALKLKHQREAK